MSERFPPEGAYFATRYRDSRRGLETRRVYYDDGRVEAFDGKEWWRVCELTAEQVRRAQEAVRASGLRDADDLSAAGVHDAATLTYAWALDGKRGQVTNHAYPARQHPAMSALDAALDPLVDAAAEPEEDEP